MASSIQSIATTGYSGIIVDIECHLSNNLPTIVIVGSASKSVDEARERIRGAFSTSRIILPRKRITVNLAPADIPKADSSFDLAIAVAILQASGQLALPLEENTAYIGELGLDGSVRAVRGIIGKLLTGRAHGIRNFYIPRGNLAQAQLVPNIYLTPIADLAELFAHLSSNAAVTGLATAQGRWLPAPEARAPDSVHLSEIVGQALAKRALEIAAAGGHNLLMSGPPGTGKSMLAKAIPALLPPLSQEEVLEVTHLHSLVDHDYERLISRRPFRAPHHTASYAALTGGGWPIRPGEISLAHRGVLFMDELPEFGHLCIEALRQPLEDRFINLSRAHGNARFPADFILIATANPCPCGFKNIPGKHCRCSDYVVERYQQHLSGPILDRIDLFISVHEVEHERLLTQPADSAADQAVEQRVLKARQRQAKRYGSARLNAVMTNHDLKRYAKLSQSAKQILDLAAQRYQLSARGYMRSVKVARTIADLDGSPAIADIHIQNALQYRRFSGG